MQFVIFLRPCFVSETREKQSPKYLVSESRGAPKESTEAENSLRSGSDKVKSSVNSASSSNPVIGNFFTEHFLLAVT